MGHGYADKFYSSIAWRNTRKAYMSSQHYICERCGNPARIVHHKKYIMRHNLSEPKITLDWDNLEALCFNCHEEEHAGAKVCEKGLMFTDDGDIVKR